jgi:hypothetical protein
LSSDALRTANSANGKRVAGGGRKAILDSDEQKLLFALMYSR